MMTDTKTERIRTNLQFESQDVEIIQQILEYFKTHTLRETADKFNFERKLLTNYRKKYNIPGHTKEVQHMLNMKAHEKCRDTKLKKYGSATYNNREQYKETCIEKYGVDNVFKRDDFQDIRRSTCQEKYGVDYYTNTDKRENTMFERYGAKDYLSSDIGQEKLRAYNNKKYGCDYAFQSKEWQDKVHTENIRKSKESGDYNNRTKCRQTNLERYGVEYYCITDECRNKGNGYHSKPNDDFASLLDDAHIKYEREFKLFKYSYDFKIGNILIEINPTITHQSTFARFKNEKIKERTYHFDKSKLAEDNGYRVIHLWDWLDKTIIIDMLRTDKKIIYARKCIFKIISKEEADNFISENHLQGSCRGNKFNFGLYYNNELVEVINFGKTRYTKDNALELLRLCSKKGFIIIGGVEKLFKNCLLSLPADMNIISYCDKSIFSGYIYSKLGFQSVNRSIIKHWVNLKTNEHYTDSYIQRNGFDRIFHTDYGKGTNNTQLMLDAGFVEVYDAGQEVYLYIKK